MLAKKSYEPDWKTLEVIHKIFFSVAKRIFFQVETVEDWWGLAKLGQPKYRPTFLDGDTKTEIFCF